MLTPDGTKLGVTEIARRLTAAADTAGSDRARLVIIRDGKLAVIERFRAGRHYYVLPGGGVEVGETIVEAALREAAEELGVVIALGALRALIHDVAIDGTPVRHWCFDARPDSLDIAIAGGPEARPSPEDGTYAAVWLDLDTLDPARVWPFSLARLVVATRGNWPADVLEITGP